ncbi:hypothetical protein QBC34DRAFT_326556 [Podospora aff. communis PSN243]|uniref:NACHT domain-containing protein n=1 Tax=Podospora aff. communis PSN243 TaxID=3040156 RepID=A0AAV9GM77_9PEZI|nr:hypothetical protein QBC34DRAFT_326556 [Podospora aff. communis PSN243]
MEALAALGLAANILQFVEFTRHLLSSTRELAEWGAKSEHTELVSIAQQLRTLAESIRPPGPDSSDNAEEDIYPDSGLGKLAKSCIEIADELLAVLDSLKTKGKNQRWRSFQHALLAVLKAEKVAALQKRMDQLSRALYSQLMATQQRQIFWKLDQLAAHNHQLEAGRTEDINYLKTALQEAFRQLRQELRAGEAPRIPMTILLNVAEKGIQYSAEQAVLDKLRFDSIDDRYQGIPLAHYKTLSWVFGTQANAVASPSPFADWLASANDLFWISGKPGSGKSTLMKYLCTHDETRRRLQDWAPGGKLVMADFFFWSAAKKMLQNSQQGLLRSLIYQIMRQSPTIIELIYPEVGQQQSLAASGIGYPKAGRQALQVPNPPDTVLGLISLLRRVCELLSETHTHCCFFIDGLDEFEGQPIAMIELIDVLRSIPNVKICVASRPWNEFEQSFGRDGSRKLYMQDLTKDDIRKYVYDVFENDDNYQELDEEHVAGNQLVEEIIKSAQGVFLWVVLVVRSFQEGLVNGDKIADLHARLRQLPRDLNEYFERILLSDVSDFYRPRSARIFAATLDAQDRLPVMAYWFLDEKEADYSFDLEIRPLSLQQMTKRLRQTRKQLNACCKGLLEAHFKLPSDGDENMLPCSIHFAWRVDFLHRTVKDFLLHPDTQATLTSWDPQPPNTNAAICSALLSQLKTAPQGHEYFEPSGGIPRLVSLFLSHCRALEDAPGSESDLPGHLLGQLDATLRHHDAATGHNIYRNVLYSLLYMEGVADRCDLRPSNVTFLHVCAGFGLTNYVARELGPSPDPTQAHLLAQLMNLAIRSANRPLVQALLRMGADPNRSVMDNQSNWQLLLHTMYERTSLKFQHGRPKKDDLLYYNLAHDLLQGGASVAAAYHLNGVSLSSRDILRSALPQDYMACLEHFYEIAGTGEEIETADGNTVLGLDNGQLWLGKMKTWVEGWLFG